MPEENRCECCVRKKERKPEEYRQLINRLNRAEGQLRAVRRMVEDGCYCPDILVQVAAVSSAVNSFGKELLAQHIRTCVAEDVRSGRDETLEELISTLQKMMKQ